MHWVCYILVLSSVFQEVFSNEGSSEGSEDSFSDDEDLNPHDGSGSGESGKLPNICKDCKLNFKSLCDYLRTWAHRP